MRPAVCFFTDGGSYCKKVKIVLKEVEIALEKRPYKWYNGG